MQYSRFIGIEPVRCFVVHTHFVDEINIIFCCISNYLETFLGMVTYLAKFAPNLSEITSPLRMLLTKDTLFSWDTPQMIAFNNVKDVITSTPSPILAYFNNQKVTTLPYNVMHPNMVLVLHLCKKESPLHLPQRASLRVKFSMHK